MVRLSAIGDTCHALAVVRRLQDNWPDARISWIIGRTEAGLLGDIADIEFIIFDKRQGLGAYREVRDALAGRRFDVVLCMHASLRVNWLYRSIGARTKLGFDKSRARDWQWLFTNERIGAQPGEHALDAMLGFATHIGAETRPVRWDIPLPDEALAFAARRMPEATVVISPVSSQRFRNYRNWPVERYRAICERLTGELGFRVLLTGGGTELERQYARALGEMPRVGSIVGESSLKELVAVLKRAAFVICPDSGPAHMATAVGTPVIGLYASSNPARTGPYRHPEFTVNRYPDAVTRFLSKTAGELRFGTRVRHPDAMSLITIEDVNDKIDDLMRYLAEDNDRSLN
ncbi:MAG: glycosyltransferase family 9 protein [Pseudomonadota bacterium]